MVWLHNHPDYSRVLLKALTRVLLEYFPDLVRNVMHVVKLFEAMGIVIKDDDYRYGKEGNMFE